MVHLLETQPETEPAVPSPNWLGWLTARSDRWADRSGPIGQLPENEARRDAESALVPRRWPGACRDSGPTRGVPGGFFDYHRPEADGPPPGRGLRRSLRRLGSRRSSPTSGPGWTSRGALEEGSGRDDQGPRSRLAVKPAARSLSGAERTTRSLTPSRAGSPPSGLRGGR